MADRPVFIPRKDTIGVLSPKVQFTWYAGYSVLQKQKSIKSLHESASSNEVSNILEISSKSEDAFGQNLSAFNLSATTKDKKKVFTVETAFQSSKIFENGGPYKDLLFGTSRAAKKDERIRNSGRLIGFEFSKKRFPIWPLTYFYDWLYAQFLLFNTNFANDLMKFNAFTDIEFNPEKSINCQAHSAALFVSLKFHNTSDEIIADPEKFLDTTIQYYKNTHMIDSAKEVKLI